MAFRLLLLVAFEGVPAKVEGEEDEESAEDEGHHAELHEVDVGVLDGLGNQGSARGLLGALVQVLDDAGEDHGSAINGQGAFEQEAVGFLDNAFLIGAGISEEGSATKKGGNDEDKGGIAEVRSNGSAFINIAVGRKDDVGDSEDEEQGEVQGEQGSGKDAHDLVEFFALAIHTEKGDVADDAEDEEENDIDNDDKGEIGIANVRGGEAIEPGGVQQEERSGKIAKGGIAAKGFANQRVIAFLDHGQNRKNQSVDANDEGGQAGDAKKRTQAPAHVGKVPELRPKERSNAKAKIDSKSAGTKAKKGEQNQVN